MARITKLVACLGLALGVISAHAGYAELATPERFTGGPGTWKFAPSANDARYGKVAFSPGALRVPVPGVNATMPAAYRFAANAPRFAAAAVFLSPHLRLAVGVASWLGLANLVWNESEKVWKATDKTSETISGKQYAVYGMSTWFDSPDKAIAYWLSSVNSGQTLNVYSVAGSGYPVFSYNEYNTVDKITRTGNKYINERDIPCPSGWTRTSAGCVSPEMGQPVTVRDENDFVDRLLPKTMPDSVPWELPYPTPLPVDDPFINPDPGPNPQHKPKFFPTGDPVPNPQYDPQKAPGPANEPWVQPGVRVTPKPTPTEPWRVETEPVNVPQPGPDPVPDTPNDPGPNDQKTPEEQKSLCEKHPDIVACAKMDEVDPDTVKDDKKTIEITPKSGWGAENSSCPAPKTLVIGGQNVEFSYQLVCDFASGIRPIIIALAWLSAAAMVITAARRNG